MTIWEIDRAMEALIDPETGELLDYEAFEQLQMGREEKIENAVLWYKNLMGDISEMRAAEVDIATRRKVKERKAEGLKRYIEQALDGGKFETARCVVSYRKSVALETSEDIGAWLYENGYRDLVVPQEPRLDKRGVTELLKQGIEIPGAELVERTNIQIK